MVTSRVVDAESEEPTRKDEHIACELEKLREWFKVCSGCWMTWINYIFITGFSSYCRYLKVADHFLPKEVKQQNEDLTKSFGEWLQYLTVGFNLLVYGIGSKKGLLDGFCKFISGYTYVTVDAYHPAVSMRTILQKLESGFSIRCGVKERNIVLWAAILANELGKKSEDVILVINNIDGVGLRHLFVREAVQQQALIELAKCKYIHIVASMDHFNTPSLWSWEMLGFYNFLWVKASTMCCYQLEILAGESKLLKLDSSNSAYDHTSASLEVIWQALTLNSRMIFVKIIKMFFNYNKPIEFSILYDRAKDDFLVNNDVVLQQHLIELLDHKLISKEQQLNGSEYISVLVDKNVNI
ncbi:unnamed protein product [Enterobius vermicularis]|uniref:Origin recognition complex subunit 2 n=1 Tax=Enterobius vermicularis TaxID=51028 RepID=A0A3P6IKY5_ENTVE|nr:unnamed protein product [Enterobius vermicularis]